jgi:phosphoribosylpyrophosphate synthetase
VHAAATHGVLAAAAAETLGAAPLESIVLTDTVNGIRRRAAFLGSKLRVLESAPLFAAAIERWLGGAGPTAPLDPD